MATEDILKRSIKVYLPIYKLVNEPEIIDEQYICLLKKFIEEIERMEGPWFRGMAEFCEHLVKLLETPVKASNTRPGPPLELIAEKIETERSIEGGEWVERLLGQQVIDVLSGRLSGDKWLNTSTGFTPWNQALILLLNRQLEAENGNISRVQIITPSDKFQWRDQKSGGRQYDFWLENSFPVKVVPESSSASTLSSEISAKDMERKVAYIVEFKLTPGNNWNCAQSLPEFRFRSDQTVNISIQVPKRPENSSDKYTLYEAENLLKLPKKACSYLDCPHPYKLGLGEYWPFRILFECKPREGSEILTSKYLTYTPSERNWEKESIKCLAIQAVYRDAVGPCYTEPVYIKINRIPR